MADTTYQMMARQLDKELVAPLRQTLQGRKLFAKTVTLDPGKYSINYDKITEMGSALMSFGFPAGQLKRDDIKISSTDLPLVTIHKGYEIDRQKFNSAIAAGKPVDAMAAISAGQVVANAEDDLLFQGWAPDGTTYVSSGLYQSAGNDYSTSKDFATAGNAMLAVAGALALNYADSVFGVNYNLSLNPVQFNELAASVLGSGAGVPEWPEVVRLLNPVSGAPKGDILITNDLTAGTGLMSPVDPAGSLIDLVIGSDAKNVLGYDSKLGEELSPVYGSVFEVIAPRIKQANSIAKLSAI